MLNEHLLIFYKNDLSVVINQPLQASNRIKFTSFDVSLQYIVFGATSGGIYIYNRKPYKFLKLLPSKEGAITNVLISQDEKIIAVSTIKGLILISLNPFVSNNGEFLVFTEHEHNNITALMWHQNFLYSGDHVGNVAVIDVTTTFAKSIFKVPSASLMLLDSSIIQLDTYGKYLLISTETKTYLCDTDEEHYKQIGKKLRNGLFGCCFINESSSNNVENVKIICARPGCRLWEADFNCQVIRTHQFKENLTESKSTLVVLSENHDGDVEITSRCNNILSDFQNFKLLKVLDNKFILTFNSKGIYIFDINTITVTWWICDCDKIKDLRTLKNSIYVWTESSDIILITLSNLEQFIRKTLSKKYLNVCSRLCLYFKEDVLTILKNTEDLHLLYVVKDYLKQNDDYETLNNLNEIFQVLEENRKVKSSVLENGIHVLTNLTTIKPDTIECNEVAMKTTNDIVISGHQDPLSNLNYDLNVLYKHYNISKNQNLDLKIIHNVFLKKTLLQIVELLKEFTLNVIKIESVDIEIPQLWCYNQFLYFIQETKQNFVNVNDTYLNEYVIEAFKSINCTNSLNCTCLFPLPYAKRHIPKYYDIGCEIMNLLHSKEDLLSNFITDIPYMWKYFLKMKQYKDIDLLLPVIMQFSDEEILNHYAGTFTYDNWDNAVKFLIKLKRNVCLNCDKSFNIDECCFNWTDFGITIIENIGSVSTIKILTRYSDEIDSNQLGINFYQTCIFATVLNNYHDRDLLKTSTRFMRDMISVDGSANEISNLLNKYLTKKHLIPIDADTNESRLIPNDKDKGECTYCNLPLNSPVLKDVIILNCGHPYHKVCFTHLNKICTTCTKVQ